MKKKERKKKQKTGTSCMFKIHKRENSHRSTWKKFYFGDQKTFLKKKTKTKTPRLFHMWTAWGNGANGLHSGPCPATVLAFLKSFFPLFSSRPPFILISMRLTWPKIHQLGPWYPRGWLGWGRPSFVGMAACSSHLQASSCPTLLTKVTKDLVPQPQGLSGLLSLLAAFCILPPALIHLWSLVFRLLLSGFRLTTGCSILISIQGSSRWSPLRLVPSPLLILQPLFGDLFHFSLAVPQEP